MFCLKIFIFVWAEMTCAKELTFLRIGLEHMCHAVAAGNLPQSRYQYATVPQLRHSFDVIFREKDVG